MAITLSDIDESLAEIARDRKKLDAKEGALRVLREAFAAEPSKLDAEPARNFHLPLEEPKASLMSDVKAVLPIFNGQEFNVPALEDALRAKGRVVPGKAPRARLAALLKELEDRGIVVRTFKESGSVPHRFKVRAPEISFK